VTALSYSFERMVAVISRRSAEKAALDSLPIEEQLNGFAEHTDS